MNYDDDAPTGAPDWVVTYGDLMSLLLTFFILLFSMSEVQSDNKFTALQSSLQRAFGSHVATDSFVHDPLSTMQGPSARGSWHGRERHSADNRHGVNDEGASGEHEKVATVRPGQHWTIGGHVLFVEDSSELSNEERENLAGIAERLAGKPMKIAVRGHTSRRPLSEESPYKDDWDLAYGRCRSVAAALLDLGIERDRIELDVIGGSEPAYAGRDQKQFAQNSRVEVYLLDRYARQFELNPNGASELDAGPSTSNSEESHD